MRWGDCFGYGRIGGWVIKIIWVGAVEVWGGGMMSGKVGGGFIKGISRGWKEG